MTRARAITLIAITVVLAAFAGATSGLVARVHGAQQVQFVLPSTPQPTPEETIAEYAALNFPDFIYFGACELTVLFDDVGKLCSLYREERDGVLAYLFGLTFAGSSLYVFVEWVGDGWLVIASDATDFEHGDIPWPAR